MDTRKIILILESVLCTVFAVLLSSTAISIYLKGVAAQAADPDASVYTQEIVAARLVPAGVVLLCIIAVAVWAKIAGVSAPDAPAGKAGRIENRTVTGREVLIRRILMAAAVCMIIAGIINGSMLDVLYKAVKICTECVGLG